MELAVILGAGLAAGLLSGLMGVGGGLILVPILVFVLGFSQHAAQGISLAVILPTALAGVWQFHRQGLVRYRLAALLSLGAVGGALASSSLVQEVSPELLRRWFGVFVIVMGARMARSRKK